MAMPIDNKKIAKKAKKDIKKAKKMEKSSKKGKLGFILSISLIAIIVLLSGVFAFNIFGARDNLLFPLLRNIPFINNFIPENLETIQDEPFLDVDAILLENENLNSIIDSNNDEIASLQARINEQNQEIVQLRIVQDQIDEHLENVIAFEEMIALGDPLAFATFFETIDPLHGQLLYFDIMDTISEIEIWNQMAADLMAMRPAAAAAIIESMINTDMDLILNIFPLMTISARSNIMNLLQAESSAAILRQMQP